MAATPPPQVTFDPASVAAATAAFPFGSPTSDEFTGVQGDTSAQLLAFMQQAQANYPLPFIPINIPAYGSALAPAGGMPIHAYSARWDNNYLSVAQRLSAASWFNWYYNNEPANQPPIDFCLMPNANLPYFPWNFQLFQCGQGKDYRINGKDTKRVLWRSEPRPRPSPDYILAEQRDNVIQPVSLTDRTEEQVRAVVGGDKTDTSTNVTGGTARDVIEVVKHCA